MDSPHPCCKIVLFGKAAVGKTSLFAWTLRKPFEVNVASTISVMYATQNFEIDGRVVQAQIWDTAGQERYASITKSYFQEAAGGMAIFDLTDAETLDIIKLRIAVFKESARPGAVVVLVGNKKDLEAQREVPRELGEAAAAELGVAYIETSAKDIEGVAEAFSLCVKEAVAKFSSTTRAMSIVLGETSEPATKPKCCK